MLALWPCSTGCPKKPCPLCQRKHLQILHEVNQSAVIKSYSKLSGYSYIRQIFNPRWWLWAYYAPAIGSTEVSNAWLVRDSRKLSFENSLSWCTLQTLDGASISFYVVISHIWSLYCLTAWSRWSLLPNSQAAEAIQTLGWTSLLGQRIKPKQCLNISIPLSTTKLFKNVKRLW